MYCSPRSVRKSDYTRSNGLSFSSSCSRKQRAYASVVAEANKMLLSNVSKSNNNQKSALQRFSAWLNVIYQRAVRSLRRMFDVCSA